jgi:NhaP-type Na+/H+ or K+/H+ antiporter
MKKNIVSYIAFFLVYSFFLYILGEKFSSSIIAGAISTGLFIIFNHFIGEHKKKRNKKE